MLNKQRKMKLSGVFNDKYRYVKTKKKKGRRCYICNERSDYYRSFYKFGMTCGHMVHQDCYKDYRSNKCPKCKKEIYPKKRLVNNGYIEFDD